MVTNVAITV